MGMVSVSIVRFFRGRRVQFLGLTCAIFFGMASCADYRAESPRHHLSMHQTSYDHPVKELPWRPPALGDVHYPRAGSDNYLPGTPRDYPYNMDTHQNQRLRAGRKTLPTAPGVKH